MKEIGKRIYFDTQDGRVVFEINEQVHYFEGLVQSIEKDIADFKALSERNRETFDVLELPFGAYAQDFAESNGYRVNAETKALEFSYPDTNKPEAPQVFQKPLSEQITELKAENLATMDALAEVYEMILGGM